MARQKVEQIQCDRCKRVQLVPPQPHDKPPDFEARLDDEKICFNDLCGYCKKTIQTLWSDLKEWNRPVKQHFGPAVDPNAAPPMDVSPNFTPAKPHSQASGNAVNGKAR